MEYRKRNFTHLISNEENDKVNEVLKTIQNLKVLTDSEKQFGFMKELDKIFSNKQIVFQIYTNAGASFQ